MGINQALLLQYEKKKLQELHPPAILQFIMSNRSNSTVWKLDYQARVWIMIRVPELFKPDANFNKTQVSERWEALWGPGTSSMGKLDVMNCIFLRFIDLSPLWIFREILTPKFFEFYKIASSDLEAMMCLLTVL